MGGVFRVLGSPAQSLPSSDKEIIYTVVWYVQHLFCLSL